LYDEESPTLYPDARGCLVGLKAAGLQLALVSNGSEVRVERELRGFGLSSAFESVLCGRKKEELKPSPVMLERTLAALGLGPNDAVYVGDAPADIQASKNAGVASVAIARNRVLGVRLRAESPDYVFGGLKDMTEFLVNSGAGPVAR
jgi:putative hydrolase of the HAD superfamily